jgi:hypothetical protein
MFKIVIGEKFWHLGTGPPISIDQVISASEVGRKIANSLVVGLKIAEKNLGGRRKT